MGPSDSVLVTTQLSEFEPRKSIFGFRRLLEPTTKYKLRSIQLSKFEPTIVLRWLLGLETTANTYKHTPIHGIRSNCFTFLIEDGTIHRREDW